MGTVGGVCERVAAEAKRGRDLFANLTELGFDEISIRKGQKYLTVVVDHHTGRLVWAHAGRDRKTVEKFLDLLGEERCKQIKLVSCDDTEWSPNPSPSAARTQSSALTRGTSSRPPPTRSTRSAAPSGTRRGAPAISSSPRTSKGARFALWKKPEKLTDRQQAKLAWIQKLNAPIYRA